MQHNFNGTPEGVLLPPALPASNDTGSVRWAGGKFGQTHQLAMLLSDEIDNYADPFVGGGNMFYHLRKSGRIKGTAYLSDTCIPLINFYQVLQHNPEQLAKAALHLHEQCGRGNQEVFNNALEVINDPNKTDFEKAVAFFVHNALVFSLATLNFTRKSAFAQTHADTRGLTLHNIRRLIANGKMLDSVVIECQDYQTAVEKLPKNTFLFLDSPYDGSDEDTYMKEFDQDLYAVNCREWSKKFHMMVTLDAGVDSMRRFNDFTQVIRSVRYHTTKRNKFEQVSLNYQPSFLTDKLELLNWRLHRNIDDKSSRSDTPDLSDDCLVLGDCLDVIDEMIATGQQFDAIITDPPYGIGYMGKAWDQTDLVFKTSTWKKLTQALKPGGYILVFSSSRHYHRLATAIEDAGMETQPFLTWTYDTGLPKPMNVANLMDRDNGVERKIVGTKRASGYCRIQVAQQQQNYSKYEYPVFEQAVSDEAQKWNGYYYGLNAMKPAHEPIYIGRKPISEKRVIDNLRTHGVGALNIEALKHRNNGKWPTSRLFHPKTTKRDHGTNHPTVKPVSLMEDLVALTCPKGGHVLDPFAGTGTTGVACKNLGMDFTLIEQDEKWKGDILRRINY